MDVMEQPLRQSLDHLFRREYAGVVARLVRRFGAPHLNLAEDAAQEALLRAMRVWPHREVPQNPSAWLYRTSSNYMIDVLRREARKEMLEDGDLLSSESEEPELAPVEDDLLRMVFACCHPAISPTDQLLLSLKLLFGLSVNEIGRALLKSPEATKRAITRAKDRFREEVGDLELPRGKALLSRTDNVMFVLYLVFNEGYAATDGDQLVKSDICEEAIRLAFLLRDTLSNSPAGERPDLDALISLMLFLQSRAEARIDTDGNLVRLEDQDRTQWDAFLIGEGLRHMGLAARGPEVTEYHLQAGIASQHAIAASFEETNWPEILRHYDLLLRLLDSPVVAMNRLVAFERVHGARPALKELEYVGERWDLNKNHHFHAIRARFYERDGQTDEAAVSLNQAIELASNQIERRFLESWKGRLTSPQRG